MIRVSDVLNYHPAPFLTRWEAKHGYKFCEKVRVEALGIGTHVDHLVRADINGQPDYDYREANLTPTRNCMKAWENFKKKLISF